MALKFVTKALALAVLLSAVANHSVHAQASASIADVEILGQTSSVRRGGGQNQRRLFYWGNLLYKLHVCSDSSGWCPEPHCHGPLAPPGCKSGSGSGSSSSGSSSSSSSSSSSAQYADAQGEGDGEAMYTDGEYVEAYAEDSSNGNSVSGGVDGQQGGSTSTSRFNAMYAVAAAAAVATLVGAFLMKKNKSRSDDDLEHQLSQSVSRRLEKLLAGKSVPPVHDAKLGSTAFVGAGADAAVVPPKTPRGQNMYDEPDQEAIEMRLDTSQLSYVKMGEI